MENSSDTSEISDSQVRKKDKRVSLKKYRNLSKKLEKWIKEYGELEKIFSKQNELIENMYDKLQENNRELERLKSEELNGKKLNDFLTKKLEKKKKKIGILRKRLKAK